MKMAWICADSLMALSMKKRHIRSGEDRQSSPPGHEQQEKKKEATEGTFVPFWTALACCGVMAMGFCEISIPHRISA
ncbi:hypothetical protein QC763_0025050 [Podospora pseudopauciseta]|uniref:Uncharacterized protein n=1 Tax=Podospora pseudopauciseta TaxID=2093780 RepID=A0ABR0I2B1_9PEZI|nr:hypothetical protein QC763_0025050 [Podospora pseudopauciseta]